MCKNFSNEQLIHVKNGELEYITFNILNKYSDKLSHGFFFRKGGVSKGEYASLNFGLIGEDLKQNVYQNYEITKEKLSFTTIHKARQAHTDNILILDRNNESKYRLEELNNEEYDCYITDEKKLATVILTADCNPIIIYDPVKNIVANIHSGWKGTVKQIYLKTATCMHNQFMCDYKDMIVCIGPSIGKCCFASKEAEFRKMFTDQWKDEDEYITIYDDGKFSINLPYLIKYDLMELGVNEDKIVLSNICTVCHSDLCFSYRESMSNRKVDCGRMGTFVELK